MKPQVQIDFKIENGDGTTVSKKLPTPSITYEWSDSSPPTRGNLPSYLPRMGKHVFRQSVA